ncbi:unnamed protein product [Sphagnum troendelagicum]|uniref:Uncharacterized protein n=1 Tax=Sphagnum troendelagicum TaxID=128251 RepID=A0ABP0TPZ7_9BRYO
MRGQVAVRMRRNEIRDEKFMKNLPVSSGVTSLYRELISAAAAADGITSISARKFIRAAAVMMTERYSSGMTKLLEIAAGSSSLDSEKVQIN